MSKKRISQALPILLFAAILTTSCGNGEAEAQATLEALNAQQTAQAAEAAEKKPEPVAPVPDFLLVSRDPPPPLRTLEDSDASIRAYEKRAVSGDNFLNNLYERPFTAEEMVYQPDLDILTVDFGEGEDFFYFTIRLNGMNPDQWGLNGVYGVEFDRTLTGRGDLVVLVSEPTEEWSTQNLSAFADKNEDVGGPQPVIADEGGAGDGYEVQIELKGKMEAYARIDPTDETAIQIAVSKALLGDPTEFLWGAWADNGLKNTALFDYNDAMTKSEAGSPINTEPEYPLKELHSLDNTCRLPYGFAQESANYPGMCINVAPYIPGRVCECIRPPGANICEWQCQ